MSTATLIGSATTLAELRKIPTPAPAPSLTREVSHVSIPHATVYDLVRDGVESNGLRIREDRIATARDDLRAFGTFVVEADPTKHTGIDWAFEPDWTLAIGWRNAHDKSSSAMLATGSNVFVCSNMCFFAEHVIGRRHTKDIMEDLPTLISEGIQNEVVAHYNKQKAQFDALKARPVSRDESILAIVEAAKNAQKSHCGGFLSKSKVMDLIAHHEASESADQHGTGTAWTLFNAGTHFAKDRWHKNSYEASRELAVWQNTIGKIFAPAPVAA